MKSKYKISTILFITLSVLWGIGFLVAYIYSNRLFFIPEEFYIMLFLIALIFKLLVFVPHVFIILSSLLSNHNRFGFALGLDIPSFILNLVLTPVIWLLNVLMHIGDVHYVDYLWIHYLSFSIIILIKIFFDIIEWILFKQRSACPSQYVQR